MPKPVALKYVQHILLGQWFSNFLRSRTTWCFFNVGVYTPWFQKNVICSNVLKINIANKRISNISITHERIITQKRNNKAFRIWQESCSRTTWKALACHQWYAYHSLRTTVLIYDLIPCRWELCSAGMRTTDNVLLLLSYCPSTTLAKPLAWAVRGIFYRGDNSGFL